MKKSILKAAIAIVAIQLFTLSAFAQKSPDLFTGVWQLKQMLSDKDLPQNVRPGYLKVFDSKGEFSHVRMDPSGAVISHRGKFTINNDNYYTETVTSESPGVLYALAGHQYKIKYTFSPDKKFITLSGQVEGKNGQAGLAYTEIWERL